MSASESPSLPLGWYADHAVTGGVDLRVVAPRRKYVVAGAAILAVLAGWRTFVNWQLAPKESVAPWLGISVLLGLLAVWCAFADEVWHIEKNCVEHRVGIGPFASSPRYRDAELAIVQRSSTNWNVPYFRLYAVMDGKPRFLIERGETQLRQLASYISFHTGWPIRPLAIQLF